MAQALRTMTVEIPLAPPGYESDLGDYQVVAVDGSSGEPVAWGFTLRRHLGDERFNALRAFGELKCIGYPNGTWSLIVKRLSVNEAIEKYGPITAEDRGPRGGFRSITFGATRFISYLDGV